MEFGLFFAAIIALPNGEGYASGGTELIGRYADKSDCYRVAINMVGEESVSMWPAEEGSVNVAVDSKHQYICAPIPKQ